MKHLKSVESYKWEFISDDNFIVKYSFLDSMDNEYLVEFKNDYDTVGDRKVLSKQYELLYFVKDDDNYNVRKIVNVNPYRTLKTILDDILNDFLKRKSWISSIRMQGLDKDFEKDFITQRTKLYVRYLQRNPIPNFELKQYGNTLKLNKNGKTTSKTNTASANRI